ncbi:MAG: tetratricopeptide repeat protein [Bdellovibrionota bacterium]
MSSLQNEFSIVKAKVDIYLGMGRYDVAEKLLKSFLESHRANANFHNLLGVVYHRQSKFDEAIQEFQRAISHDANFIEASLNLAATFCDLSQYDEAQKVFEKLKTTCNFSNRTPVSFLEKIAIQHVTCGNMYEQCSMDGEAVNEYKQALKLSPKLSSARLALSKLHLKQGKIEEAKRELEEILKYEPSFVDARAWQGIVYYKQGDVAKAKEIWELSEQEFPNSPSLSAFREIYLQ